MISFRLSETDYHACRRLCLEQGVASVSEMARAAVKLLLASPEQTSQHILESRVSELEGRLHMLSLELKRLRLPAPQAFHLLADPDPTTY